MFHLIIVFHTNGLRAYSVDSEYVTDEIESLFRNGLFKYNFQHINDIKFKSEMPQNILDFCGHLRFLQKADLDGLIYLKGYGNEVWNGIITYYDQINVYDETLWK